MRNLLRGEPVRLTAAITATFAALTFYGVVSEDGAAVLMLCVSAWLMYVRELVSPKGGGET